MTTVYATVLYRLLEQIHSTLFLVSSITPSSLAFLDPVHSLSDQNDDSKGPSSNVSGRSRYKTHWGPQRI